MILSSSFIAAIVTTTAATIIIIIPFIESAHFGFYKTYPKTEKHLCERMRLRCFDSVNLTSISWYNRQYLVFVENRHKYHTDTKSPNNSIDLSTRFRHQFAEYNSNLRAPKIGDDYEPWYKFFEGYNVANVWTQMLPPNEYYVRHYLFNMDDSDAGGYVCKPLKLWPTCKYAGFSHGSYLAVFSQHYIRWIWLPTAPRTPPVLYTSTPFDDPRVAPHNNNNNNSSNTTTDSYVTVPSSVSFITNSDYNWNNQKGLMMVTKRRMYDNDDDQFVLYKFGLKPESITIDSMNNDGKDKVRINLPQFDTDRMFSDDYYLLELTNEPNEIRIVHQSLRNHLISGYNNVRYNRYDQFRFFQFTNNQQVQQPQQSCNSTTTTTTTTNTTSNCSSHYQQQRLKQPHGFFYAHDLVLVDPNLYCVFVIQHLKPAMLNGSRTNLVLHRVNIPWEYYFSTGCVSHQHWHTKEFGKCRQYPAGRCDTTVFDSKKSSFCLRKD